MNERRKIDVLHISREIESASHTLIDLKTVSDCNKLTIERCEKTQKSIEPRIKLLEERIDRLTIELGQNKESD